MEYINEFLMKYRCLIYRKIRNNEIIKIMKYIAHYIGVNVLFYIDNDLHSLFIVF